jgi:hypothetical protein
VLAALDAIADGGHVPSALARAAFEAIEPAGTAMLT